MGVTALFGGAFDPPHEGHVALLEAAVARFEPERVVVLVSVRPGHKHVELDPEIRLRLARAAFPGHDVELDPHARTIDLLRDCAYEDPVFLIGADQFRDFPAWTEPDAVLELARLGVATRPGVDRVALEATCRTLRRPDRVEFFEIPGIPVSSRELRAGASLAGLVPPPVEALIAELGLYRG